MDDIRWFAPNRYCTLPVPRLRAAGLRIALEGDAPARLAFASDGQCAVEGYEYALRHRCPLVLYLWDLPPWRLGSGRPDHIFMLASRVRRIPRLTNRYPERSGYYSRIRHVARRAVEVWAPSAQSADDAGRRFGITVARIPFCFDSDRFAGPAEPAPRGRPTILAISRLVPHKDHALVLQAAAQITARPAVRIIGLGPEAGRLRALARDLGVDLELADDWASDDAVVAAYRSASVIVSASRFEGFGLTPMEGLAMGCPVVASDIPVHREFLDESVTWFPPGDASALAQAIQAALTARRRMVPLPELSIDACAARLLLRFSKLLDQSR